MSWQKFINLVNPYYHLVNLRNFFYDKGLLKSYQVNAFVISVGNLSLGGSGKTSLVKFLAENLYDRFRISIISRGYKRKTKGYLVVYHEGKIFENAEKTGDEPFLLAKLFEKKNFL